MGTRNNQLTGGSKFMPPDPFSSNQRLNSKNHYETTFSSSIDGRRIKSSQGRPLTQIILIFLILLHWGSVIVLTVFHFKDQAWISGSVNAVGSIFIGIALLGAIKARHGVMMLHSVFSLLWCIFAALMIFVLLDMVYLITNSNSLYKQIAGETLLTERNNINAAAIAVSGTNRRPVAVPRSYHKPLFIGLYALQLACSIFGLISTCLIPIQEVDDQYQRRRHGPNSSPRRSPDIPLEDLYYYDNHNHHSKNGQLPNVQLSPTSIRRERRNLNNHNNKTRNGFSAHIRNSLRKSRHVISSYMKNGANGASAGGDTIASKQPFEFSDHLSPESTEVKGRRNHPGRMKKRGKEPEKPLDSFYAEDGLYSEDVSPEDFYNYGDFRGRQSQHWRLK